MRIHGLRAKVKSCFGGVFWLAFYRGGSVSFAILFSSRALYFFFLSLLFLSPCFLMEKVKADDIYSGFIVDVCGDD
jgi:hypothetical protein